MANFEEIRNIIRSEIERLQQLVDMDEPTTEVGKFDFFKDLENCASEITWAQENLPFQASAMKAGKEMGL